MTTLTFAVTQAYAIPYNVETYKMLMSHNVLSTRLNAAFIHGLGDLLHCKVETVQLDDMLKTAIAKTEAFWTKSESFTKFVQKDASTFVLSGALDNKDRIKKIELTWRKFFNRWGYKADFVYDETQTRCKLTVTYSHTLQPEIEVEDEIEVKEYESSLKLGSFSISMIEFEGQKLLKIVDTGTNLTIGTARAESVLDYGLLIQLIELATHNAANLKVVK